MNIIYEYTNVTASDRLEDAANEKLNHLAHKFPFVQRAYVYFTIEKHKENTGHICKIRLASPGHTSYASTAATDFVDAIHQTVRELSDQLEKQKEKMKTY